MTSLPKPKLAISARYLGPVFSLDSELSEKRQNLIFARNGTGKSFLSRTLRYLDKAGDSKDISDAAINLVSDESPDGRGSFILSRGAETLGNLSVQKNGDLVVAEAQERIFHVFSEDFVHEELREKLYNPDGNIQNQIAVDSENIKLKEGQEAVVAAEAAEAEASNTLRESFDAAKISEVHEKAGVNKQLRDYKALVFEDVLGQVSDKPDVPDRSFADTLKDLDSLKSIPAEPVYPEPVVSIRVDNIDVEAIQSSLQKITSPSAISASIKQKIDAHHDFFKTGVEILGEHDADACPFCDQSIQKSPAKETIETYIAYFKDEEEKHKSELRRYYKVLKDKETEIRALSPRIVHQRTRFDALKCYLPSKRDEQLADCETEIEQACTVITRFKDAIEAKASALGQGAALPTDNLAERMKSLAVAIDGNNAKVAILRSAIEKSDEERKSLQRNACAIFLVEFTREHWSEIAEILKLSSVSQAKREEFAALEKASPKTDAKERVADTFEQLLRDFFAKKYVFDRKNFVLKRGDSEMARGPHRTLSDGEKTAIAFCYFVASIHRKVESNGDYQKLFLVFDDPVTSMSYDFIFTIAQTLKNLSISKQGDISTNPTLLDGNIYVRPELIILTHSSYFFNISLTNLVVKNGAAFALHPDKTDHKLTRFNTYVAPFQQQLKDIYDVAENDKEPDHQTGNSVRSVLEAVGRFCRPDKSRKSTDFMTFLVGEDEFNIKSLMIHNLSHGTYYEEVPPPDDLKLACKETIEVVKKFAVGQLEIIRGA